MKAISLEKRHLRRAAVRRLGIVSGIGAFLTFLFGAWIAPWIAAIAEWVVHQTPWWHHAGGFPNLLHFLITPDMRLGLIWLVYYGITYLWAKSTLSPREKQALQVRLYQEYHHHYDTHEWSFPQPQPGQYQYTDAYADDHYDSTPRRPRKEDIPLSHAWPGELKHQLVERCYEQYRQALKRYDPPPIDLKTPLTFAYRRGGPLEWDGPILILPEEMLTPERIGELLPFLPLALADYNSETITTEETHGYPDHVPLPFLLFITGNFLWLPVAFKHDIEDQVEAENAAQQRSRVLEHDEFAVYLGQGPALEHQLRRMDDALKRRKEIDTSQPTLIERIGRLEVLNERERKAMRKLGLKPKQLPLEQGMQQRQLKKGEQR